MDVLKFTPVLLLMYHWNCKCLVLVLTAVTWSSEVLKLLKMFFSGLFPITVIDFEFKTMETWTGEASVMDTMVFSNC